MSQEFYPQILTEVGKQLSHEVCVRRTGMTPQQFADAECHRRAMEKLRTDLPTRLQHRRVKMARARLKHLDNDTKVSVAAGRMIDANVFDHPLADQLVDVRKRVA